MNNENHQTSRNSGLESWQERVAYQSPAVLAVLLWAFTAVRFQPGIEFLLLFGMLLGGAAVVGQMTLRWGGGQSSSSATLATCLVGVIMMIYAWVELASLPEYAPAPLRMLLILLWMVAIAYMRRVATQEKAARP